MDAIQTAAKRARKANKELRRIMALPWCHWITPPAQEPTR